eukprot:UN17164
MIEPPLNQICYSVCSQELNVFQSLRAILLLIIHLLFEI